LVSDPFLDHSLEWFLSELCSANLFDLGMKSDLIEVTHCNIRGPTSQQMYAYRQFQ